MIRQLLELYIDLKNSVLRIEKKIGEIHATIGAKGNAVYTPAKSLDISEMNARCIDACVELKYKKGLGDIFKLDELIRDNEIGRIKHAGAVAGDLASLSAVIQKIDGRLSDIEKRDASAFETKMREAELKCKKAIEAVINLTSTMSNTKGRKRI